MLYSQKPASNIVLNLILMALLVNPLGSILLRAQNTEGTVLGTVKDPSGAVVAGATVHLRNQGTGAERSAVTDMNGDYRFTNSEVGSYVLSIEASGFQKEQFSQFDLLARETRRLDVTSKGREHRRSRSAFRRRKSPISRPTLPSSPRRKRGENWSTCRWPSARAPKDPPAPFRP